MTFESVQEAADFDGTVLIVRTDKVDDTLVSFLADVEKKTDLRICLAADGKKIEANLLTDINHVAATVEAYGAMNLFVAHDTLWRCGDYCLYLVRAKYPKARFFWMVERDVYVNTRDIGYFFGELLRFKDADFVGSRYHDAKPAWAWYSAMVPFSSQLYQCVFPVVGFSGRAVDCLYERRKEISARYMDTEPKERQLWPNDEIFCATVATNAGLVCRDLNDLGPSTYTRQTLKLTPPLSLRRLMAAKPDELLYHPVLSGDEFIQKLETRLAADIKKRVAPQELLATYDKTVREDVALECGEERAKKFECDLNLALESCDAKPKI